MNATNGSTNVSHRWIKAWFAVFVAPGLLIAGCAMTDAPPVSAEPAPAMTHDAFFKAAEAGDLEAVRAGVDAHPEWVNTFGYHWDCPPLHYAASEGHAEVAALLIARGADVNAYNERWRWRPIHEAAMEGHLEVVRLLLDSGADMEVRNFGDLTPLAMAVGSGHRDIVLLLLERGADANARGEKGWALLHIAANRSDAELVGLLLDKGLAIDARTEAGRTPLHWAATAEMANALIEAGADVNDAAPGGRTPLHLAAFFGFAEVAEALLARGASINPADAAGRTPLDLAAAEKHEATAAMLRSRGGEPGKSTTTRPASRTETRIGSRGQFYLNGEPIIPIGVWQQPPILFAYNRALGLDCLVYPPGGSSTGGSSTPDYVLAAQESDLGVFLHYGDELIDLPGVWGWIGGGWPIDEARRVYELLRRTDDGRVIICNFGGHGLVKNDPDAQEFYRSVFPYIDVLVPHVWPGMFEDEPRNLRNVALLVDNARKLCEGRPLGEISIWADINPHAWGKGARAFPAPTVAEFTYQIWLALIHGADGICLFPISFDPFVFSQIPAQMEEALPGICKRVRTFAAHLASEPSPRTITVRGEDPEVIVDFTTRRYQGNDYVFVVNGEADQTVHLEVDGLGATLALYDALADERLAANEGTYSHKMEALELMIWCIAPGDDTE